MHELATTLNTGTSGTYSVPAPIVSSSSFFGLNTTTLLIAFVVLAVIFIVAFGLSQNRGDDYYRRTRMAGTKGGRVKRVIEYDEDDIEEEVL